MIVDSAVYVDGRQSVSRSLEGTHDACHNRGGFAWIGLYEPTEEEFASVTSEFELHPLAVEDAVKAHQRPKVERYGDATSWCSRPYFTGASNVPAGYNRAATGHSGDAASNVVASAAPAMPVTFKFRPELPPCAPYGHGMNRRHCAADRRPTDRAFGLTMRFLAFRRLRTNSPSFPLVS